MEIQRRYQIYCDLAKKKPLSFPNHHYTGFINSIAAAYKKEKNIVSIIDQEDFDAYIRKNGKKYLD